MSRCRLRAIVPLVAGLWFSVLAGTASAREKDAPKPGAADATAGGSPPTGEGDSEGEAATNTAGDSPEESEARALAKRKYERGVQAFEEGRYSDAVDLLLEADRAMPNPAFDYNIALAYDAMGDTAAALGAYREYIRESPDADDRVEVLERISALEYELQKRGVQQVTILSTPEGATIELDGRPVGVTPWTGEIEPGRHELTLMKRGYRDATRAFEQPAERALDLVLALHRRPGGALEISRPAGAAPAPSATTTPPESRRADRGAVAESRPPVRPWTWVALGAGGATMAGALTFELLRRQSEDDALRASQRAYHDELDQMNDRKQAARILAGVGSVLTISGVGLLVFDLTRSNGARDTGKVAPRRRINEERSNSHVRLSDVNVACGPAGCHLGARGRF